jgi:transposase
MELKHDLAIRPIYHYKEERIEAHIFVAFLAYCLQITLRYQLKRAAPDLTPRAALEKFKTMQLVDVQYH